jgi:signal transduction histidine kinase
MDLRKHSIESRTDLAENLPTFMGNEVQLQQVILNLVMNGIEAMSSTEPRVLSLKSACNGRNCVHVSIEDTGNGIDPSNVDRIFKPLFTTKTRGMGIGLSICRSIIEAHDGRIWVSPGVPRGSIFQFELPLTRRA